VGKDVAIPRSRIVNDNNESLCISLHNCVYVNVTMIHSINITSFGPLWQ